MGRAGLYPGTHWLFLSIFMVFLIRWTDPGGVGSEVNAHGLYASHNFCISHKVRYDMELFPDEFSVFEKIWLRPLENVYECYIHAEKFEVIEVRAGVGRNQTAMVMFDPVLQLLPYGIYSIRRSSDKMWSYEEEYMLEFSATKYFSKVGEGLTFKMYRERSTFKRSWYAFVHMSPSQCGKAFFCTNNLKDLHSLRIQAIHWKTHNLNCAGTTTTKSHSKDKAISVCLNTFKVGVNNMHYSLTNFPKLDYVTNDTDGEHTLHHITIVAPKNEQSVIDPMIVEHFNFILRIYSLLILTTNLKPFHVIFYVLPNYNKDVPEVFSGSCYYKLEHLLYNIDLETTQRSYLKCLLHQGYLNERITDSWVLRYVPEGLFERLVNTYEVQGVKNDYYQNVLLGDEDELDSMARYDKYLGDIPLKRPWRKAAGFWHMLDSISPSYGEKTYGEFADNIKPIESQADFVKWITKHCELLKLDPKAFLEMHYTWTATKGYPILVAKVNGHRKVCVSQYSEGMFFSSRIIPYTLNYNYPNALSTDLLWITAKSQDNCHTSTESLFPYLVNGNLNMVGRVLYDPVNWQVWAKALMKGNIRSSLTTMQKVSLVMDALYFAQNNQLDWTMFIKFLVLLREETDELAWRSYDKVLGYLESLTRYTQIYTMYKKLVAEIVQEYYYSRDSHPTGIAIKWSCFAGVVECLRYTEEMTARTLIDHEYMPNRTEVLCGGMRRMTIEKFKYLIGSMGKPDWREPIFYIEIITCSNNGKILRELMHHLFFYQSWYFRSSLLQKILIEMIENGKAGSDAVLYYLDHNPKGMLKQLEIDNLLDVFGVLSKYTRHCLWLQRFIKRMEVYRSWDEKHLKRLDTMFLQMRKNKMWYNRHYSMFVRYLVEGYLLQLLEYEL